MKRIRNKDPVIYKKDTAFFGDEGSSDDKEDGDKEEGGKKAVKKSKPMYLKDVIAKQALEEADGAESDSDGGEVRQGPSVYGSGTHAFPLRPFHPVLACFPVFTPPLP